MMRNRNFCCISFVLVAVIITFINYFILKTSITEPDNIESHLPISFSALESDASGLYKIWPLFSKSGSNIKNHIDITIVTQSSVSNLPDVETLVNNWDGPVSVGVFAPGKELELAVEALYTMRICNQAVASNVVFSVVMTLSHPPRNHEDLSVYLRKASSHPRVCQSVLSLDDASGVKRRKNYDNLGVQYPVNLLRNIALKNAKTSHVLVIDVDMSPSANLRRNFQREYPSIKRDNGVYVIPTFELKRGVPMPTTKKEVLDLWAMGKVRPFYQDVCWKCQKYTDYKKWRKSSSNTLSVIYQVEWQDPWEPFFIAESKSIVNYDERFKQYGFNRISQVCETHISGGNFFVLDDAFLIHRGFKDKHIFHMSKDAENAINRDLYRTLKKELKSKYQASDRHC